MRNKGAHKVFQRVRSGIQPDEFLREVSTLRLRIMLNACGVIPR